MNGNKNISVVLYSSGGGLEMYTLQLANALCKYMNVGFAIDKRTLETVYPYIDKKITIFDFQRPRLREMKGFWEMRNLSKKINKWAPDIFHLQGNGVWESLLLRFLSGSIIINTVHDPIKHIDYRTPINIMTMRDAIHRAAGWVVHSENLKKIFAEINHVDQDKVLVHCHGVYDYYLNFYKPSAARGHNILFFGELRHNKGLDILLRAFNNIKAEIPEWNITIAGRGILKKTLQPIDLIKKKLIGQSQVSEEILPLIQKIGHERCVLLNRYISDIETSQLFANAGIVALPYRHGSQSGVLALAGAFGCPVIATEVGNINELLGNNIHAILVPAENEDALSEGIVSLAKDFNTRLFLSKNLHELSTIRWSWDLIANKTIGFYEKLLASKNARK